MRTRVRSVWFWAAACLWPALAAAADPLPREVSASLARSGLPLKSFGFYVGAVEGDAPAPLAALNPEQPFLMASTAKLVTSFAALDLLGADHQWRTHAYATGPVVDGHLAGDLVIVGGETGVTRSELARWFRQMRSEGLAQVAGRIVLQGLSVLQDDVAAALQGGAEDPATAADVGRGPLVVAVRPAGGTRAGVSLQPHPPGVAIVNDVFMGGGCSAWAQWRNARSAGTPTLWVRGRWDASCGRKEIAYVKAPALAPAARGAWRGVGASATTVVAAAWTETGGRLRGRVVESKRRAAKTEPLLSPEPWTSELATALPAVIRDINKTSNNLAARQLFLSLAPDLRAAQDHVHAWLREQGLADGDIRLDVGSGQSRLERGKPRAMVQLLRQAWHSQSSAAFVDSLPIAGVDGTLARRMRNGLATGQAFLKTGTLSDTRALAGYVRGKSGTLYAVAAVVNHPQAARATPVLDSLIEWVVKNG
ncbi:MAG TPA: D-alanyl-D-alanine carboxypeptidase [Albitalea sp.]|uniref:D-alanyl-D-alanine carboxypeptidase/D-alanyl-D-alanine-endopeptidase n=1 Tax=Piscinibacter sp. TaxID=1903157 RepID=UPI002ED64ABD